MNRKIWVLTPLCLITLVAPLPTFANDMPAFFKPASEPQPVFKRIVYTTLPDVQTESELSEFGLRSGAVQDPLLAWFADSLATKNTSQMMSAIRESAYHGLDPESYSLTELTNRMTRLMTLPEGSPAKAKEERALSRIMDESFKLLVSHLGSGVFDGPSVQPELHRDVPVVDSDLLLGDVKTGAMSVQQALWEIMPTDEAYFRLTDTLRSLLGELEYGMPRTRVHKTGKLELGDESVDVLNVKDRLSETGDLLRNGKVTRVYDKELVTAVKRFQERHGLEQTGIVDNTARDILNSTVEDDILKVAMSLERWRWMPRNLGTRHVLVNVPEFRAKLYNEGQKIVDMPVVVGAVKHKTPIFSRDIKFVEVAPTWTVPASITNKELIPLERRKPGYLASKRFDYFRWTENGMKLVPPGQVTPQDFEQSKFPYILRQRSGAGNALGKLKILMPNPWAIYMHDTQAKKYFKKRVRAYSHGCIRLSDPDRMASLIMQLDGISKSKVDRYLNSENTKRITIRSEIPAHLAYFTAWIDDDGMLHTRSDIYRHDRKLKRAMQRGNTVLAALERRANGRGTRLAKAGF